MFFPDKLAALKEVARVLKPDGMFIFNIWDSYEHNHLIQTVNDSLVRLFPDNPPPFFDVPYGYYKIDEVKQLLGQAGFGDIEISVSPRESVCESARQVALGYILGTPVCIQIADRNAMDLQAVVDIVEEDLCSVFDQYPVKAKMQGIVFEAYLPVQS